MCGCVYYCNPIHTHTHTHTHKRERERSKLLKII
jgi:hypothetical protein